jgi:hypothetical protein
LIKDRPGLAFIGEPGDDQTAKKGSKEMKKIVIILLVCLASIALCFNNALALTLKLSDDFITVGETFSAELWTEDGIPGEDLLGFGFDLEIQTDPLSLPAAFSFHSYSVNDSLFEDVPLPFEDTIIGAVWDGVTINPNSDTLLATLNFTALEVGMSTLFIDGDVGGISPLKGLFGEFTEVDFGIWEDIQVNPVPEPSTIVLLGFGLMGLVGLGKKRKK